MLNWNNNPKQDLLIKLVVNYTNNHFYEFVIKSCQLKPIEFLKKNILAHNVKLYKWWIDDFGSSLKIEKDKYQIILNDLLVDRKKIIDTDIYSGLSYPKITKISKLICIITGKDEDLNEDYCLSCFWGIDNILRTYQYIFGEWKKISSLLLGFDILKLIYINRNINNYIKLEIDNNFFYPCKNLKMWLSSLPCEEALFREVDCNRFYFLIKGI